LEDTILFIAMEFIPLNLGGVFRPLRFANGLNSAGIRPVIITFEDNTHLRKVQNRFDYALMDRLDKDIPVYRIPLDDIDRYRNNRLKRFWNVYFNATDIYSKAWKKNLFERLPEIISKHQPKAVFVTCPPYSAAPLATEISKTYRLPLIVDMRDAWAKLWNPLGSYFHFLHRKLKERATFEQASAIITVTPRLKGIFEETHPATGREKFHLVYNGFDFDLPDTLRVRSEPIAGKATYNIGYVGSFYYDPVARDLLFRPWWKKKGHRMLQYSPVKEDWLYRSPYFFFRCMARLFERRPEWRSKLFFHHVGDTPEWLGPMAEEMGVRDNLVVHGFQTQDKVLKLQESFDLLLATSEKVIGNEHFCLPSKLFTYLRSGKPVLAFVTRGIQYEFLQRSGLGLLCDPDDTGSASLQMEKAIEHGYEGELNVGYLRQFSNPVATAAVADLVRTIIKGKDH
jgi:hypothetical protein